MNHDRVLIYGKSANAVAYFREDPEERFKKSVSIAVKRLFEEQLSEYPKVRKEH